MIKSNSKNTNKNKINSKKGESLDKTMMKMATNTDRGKEENTNKSNTKIKEEINKDIYNEVMNVKKKGIVNMELQKVFRLSRTLSRSPARVSQGSERENRNEDDDDNVFMEDTREPKKITESE